MIIWQNNNCNGFIYGSMHNLFIKCTIIAMNNLSEFEYTTFDQFD